MKNFKKDLQYCTKKNTDELICSEVSKKLKKMCIDLEEEKNDDNEEVINEEKNQIKDRMRKIKWVFINFDKCMEFIEPKSVFSNFQIQKRNDNEIDEKILLSTEECLKELYVNIKEDNEKEQVLSRIKGLKNLMKDFDGNMLKIQRMEMQQTKLGYLALAEGR